MVLAHERHRDLLRTPGRQQFPRKHQLFIVRLGGKDWIVKKPLAIPPEDGGHGWRRHPGGVDPSCAQNALHATPFAIRCDEDAQAISPCPAGTAAAMQQRFAIFGEVGMNDQIEFWQIDAARGNVRCNANPGPAIAHRLQSTRALVLAQFPGKGDD